jgi:hypothetical protein
LLTWHHRSTRRLVIAAAAIFYAGRCASALYFAPNALTWGDDPASADLDQVRRWMNLNWVRVAAQDAATPILLLVAAAGPARTGSRRWGSSDSGTAALKRSAR